MKLIILDQDAAAEILKNHKKLDILVNSSGMLHVGKKLPYLAIDCID
jgi:hypothetical protein